MGITLDQLVYDATDGGAEVGSHVLAGTDGTAIGHTGDALHVDLQNASIVVTATQLDIDDLNATDDAVQAWAFDGTGNAIGSTTGSLDVNLTNASIATTVSAPDNPKTSTASVGTSAVEIASTPLANRTRILVQNKGSKDIYFGEDNTVTTSTGICVPRGASMELPYSATANIWGISSAAAQDVRVLELD